MKKVALVSVPWPLYDHPSIQLGCLKGFLRNRIPDQKIDAFHFYLQVAEAIGYEVYQAVSERSRVAESVYAALLFPERTEGISHLFYRRGARNSCDVM